MRLIQTGYHHSRLAMVATNKSSEIVEASVRYHRKCIREKRKAGEMDDQTENSAKIPRLHAQRGRCSCSIQTEMPPTSDSALQTEVLVKDCEVQTDVSMRTFSAMEEEMQRLQLEYHQQEKQTYFLYEDQVCTVLELADWKACS